MSLVVHTHLPILLSCFEVPWKLFSDGSFRSSVMALWISSGDPKWIQVKVFWVVMLFSVLQNAGILQQRYSVTTKKTLTWNIALKTTNLTSKWIPLVFQTTKIFREPRWENKENTPAQWFACLPRTVQEHFHDGESTCLVWALAWHTKFSQTFQHFPVKWLFQSMSCRDKFHVDNP
jgi:hypothetical protein